MNNLLSQKWCLCLNVQNRIKLCRAKNHKFGDETTVCSNRKHNSITIMIIIIKKALCQVPS